MTAASPPRKDGPPLMANGPQAPDISVVVVNWNTRGLLRDCLASLADKTRGATFEAIVVDNGSGDGSAEMVRAEFPGAVLIENGANLGFAKACNIGIARARGRSVALVNTDVLLVNDCLGILQGYLARDPGAGVVGPKTLYQDMTLNPSCRRFPTVANQFCAAFGLHQVFRRHPWARPLAGEHMWDFDHGRTREVETLVGSFLLLRKEAIDAVGWFDEDFFIFSEETDLCLRLRKGGWKVVFHPEAVAIHFGKGSSSSDRGRFEELLIVSKLKFWKKHKALPARAAFTLILAARHLFLLLGALVKRGAGRMRGEEFRRFARGRGRILLALLRQGAERTA